MTGIQTDYQPAKHFSEATVWLMNILMIPAFGASLLFVLMGINVLAIVLSPHGHFDQNNLKMIRGTAIIVASAIIIFAACIFFTDQLSKKERIKWLLLTVFVPPIGLPMFHQLMYRRLNIRKLQEKLKVQRAETFLEKIEVPREMITDEQFEVIVAHCEKTRGRRIGGAASAVICAAWLGLQLWAAEFFVGGFCPGSQPTAAVGAANQSIETDSALYSKLHWLIFGRGMLVGVLLLTLGINVHWLLASVSKSAFAKLLRAGVRGKRQDIQQNQST